MFQVHEKVVVSSMSIHHQIFQACITYYCSILCLKWNDHKLSTGHALFKSVNYELVLVKITFAPS
jgi:hypothetical protein